MTPEAMPSAFDRAEMIGRLDGTTFDVLVIGGGITGCGVAPAPPPSRGLSVALVERDDFASGTSSKSSKLVHGGLRYLQQGDVLLVKEALRERQRLIHNAPHLVTPLPFLIPVLTKDGPVSTRIAKALRSALWMYDVSGGWRIGHRYRRLRAAEALAHCPTLPADRLSSGFVYYDAEADDARLTLTIARTAAAHGAVVANRCEVVDLVPGGDGKLTGAVVRDRLDGSRRTISARCVVSAAGVWIDQVRALESASDPTETGSVRPAKGVHVTIPWDLVRNEIAVVIAVPKDRRSLFLVPWGPKPEGGFSHCFVGTTDTEHHGDVDDPHTDADDLDYVLRALSHSITPPRGRPIGLDDVTAVWAGLRPLVSDASSDRTADLSRRHRISVSDAGLVSVTGGKLTTYRQMAEDTVDVVMDRLGLPVSRRVGRSRTARLRLVGASGSRRSSRTSTHLSSRHGDEADTVARLVDADPSLAAPLVPGLPYLRAEAIHAVREEMAMTLDDVLMRRTRAHLFDRSACRQAAPDVAALIGAELGWSPARITEQVEGYVAVCDAEERAAGVRTEGSTT
ncbi:MAG: FAD-dependent oxidoreductase [Ilumatobacteraceae bacterium]